MDFWPPGTSTCRRECGLSKSKYVANILSLSSSLCYDFFCPLVSCSFSAIGSTCSVYLIPGFIYNPDTLLLQILVYR